MSARRVPSIDRTRSLVELTVDHAELESSCVLAEGDDVADLIDRFVDSAAVALAADGLGAAARALDMSVSYAKERSNWLGDRLVSGHQAQVGRHVRPCGGCSGRSRGCGR